jgi:hypothetical protein
VTPRIYIASARMQNWPQLGVPNVIQSSVEPIGTHDQSTGLEPYQLTQPGWAAAPAKGAQPGTMTKGRMMRPFIWCSMLNDRTVNHI